MVKVLVLGASGYIGGAVSKALALGGHEVYGQTRDVAKNGKTLQQNEITPLQSDPASDDKWLEVITEVDAIIDCLGGSAPIADLSAKLIKKTEEASSAKRHPTAGKIVYIWTSGYLLHNDDRFSSQSEFTPSLNPPAKVSWRPAVEKQLTSSTVLDGTVIRPPLIYGGSGSITALIFKQFLGNDKIKWPGSPGLRWPTAHVADVAQAFRLAVEKAPLVKGLILDIANPATESIDALMNHLCAYTGKPADAWEYRAPASPLDDALVRTVIVRSPRATSLLGWQPTKLSLIDGLPRYFETYKAHI
ncbi:unnamed protein product [Parajaminaea phylloscopi]